MSTLLGLLVALVMLAIAYVWCKGVAFAFRRWWPR